MESCASRCNEKFDRDAACQCDRRCPRHRDCCEDYERLCTGEVPCGMKGLGGMAGQAMTISSLPEGLLAGASSSPEQGSRLMTGGSKGPNQSRAGVRALATTCPGYSRMSPT